MNAIKAVVIPRISASPEVDISGGVITQSTSWRGRDTCMNLEFGSVISVRIAIQDEWIWGSNELEAYVRGSCLFDIILLQPQLLESSVASVLSNFGVSVVRFVIDR